MIRLAKQYGRYGYRKIAKLLRIEGWHVNHKKVERLWQEEGLLDLPGFSGEAFPL
jgi:putative transposase